MALNNFHWLGLNVPRETAVAESGQMAKTTDQFRCAAVAPNKPETFRCNWHVRKHPPYHMYVETEHNGQETILWQWPVNETTTATGSLCETPYIGAVDDFTLRCSLEKGHTGLHRGENEKTIANW